MTMLDLRLITLFLMIKMSKTLFIGDNFNQILETVCSTHKIMIVQFNNYSILPSFVFNNRCAIDRTKEFSDFDKIIYKYRIILIELSNENQMNSLNDRIFDTFLSLKLNFVIIVKNGAIDGIENRIFHRFDGFRWIVIRYETDLSAVNVSYVRPIVNGCHLYEGVLRSTDDGIQELIASSACNLNGSVVRVVANSVSSDSTSKIPYYIQRYERFVRICPIVTLIISMEPIF